MQPRLANAISCMSSSMTVDSVIFDNGDGDILGGGIGRRRRRKERREEKEVLFGGFLSLLTFSLFLSLGVWVCEKINRRVAVMTVFFLTKAVMTVLDCVNATTKIPLLRTGAYFTYTGICRLSYISSNLFPFFLD